MEFKNKNLNAIYEEVIKPLILDFIYIPVRIDNVQKSGKVSDKVLEEIANSKIIIAELTELSKNFYYEAGFAHAIGKEVIFTARKGTIVPIDLPGAKVIEWKTKSELEQELIKKFKSLVKKTETKK